MSVYKETMLEIVAQMLMDGYSPSDVAVVTKEGFCEQAPEKA